MNKKYNTYLLLSLVLCVWGYLAYQVLDYLQPKQTSTTQTTLKSYMPQVSEEKEKFSLLLNYDSPFEKTNTTEPKKVRENTPAPQKNTSPPPPVRYIGYIEQVGKQKLFIIQYNSNQLFLKLNESAGDIKIIQGDEIKIILLHNGQRFVFKRN